MSTGTTKASATFWEPPDLAAAIEVWESLTDDEKVGLIVSYWPQIARLRPAMRSTEGGARIERLLHEVAKRVDAGARGEHG